MNPDRTGRFAWFLVDAEHDAGTIVLASAVLASNYAHDQEHEDSSASVAVDSSSQISTLGAADKPAASKAGRTTRQRKSTA
jgi:hypothetical protein